MMISVHSIQSHFFAGKLQKPKCKIAPSAWLLPNMFFFPQHHWKYLHAGFNHGFTHCHSLSRFSSVYALGLNVIRDKTRASAKKRAQKSLLVSL